MSQFERIVRERYLLDADGLWIRFAEISGQNTFPFWFALRSDHRKKHLLKKIVGWDAGHTMLWSISVNLVILQGLMRTPQDCKVMWVAACKFFAIWSSIRGWQCHRIVCHKLLPSSKFGKFHMELPILICDLIAKTFLRGGWQRPLILPLFGFPCPS